MKYIYTVDNCVKCDSLKSELYDTGEYFEERDADRLKRPEDGIDREALIQASMQNMELPVVVDV